MSIASLDYDVVRAEVFRKGLEAIAQEMAITLMRTSGSPVVTDGMDFSTSVLDANGEQIGFSGYVAFHVSTSFLGVEAVREAYSADDLAEGDGFLINDPHTAGAIHQGDMAIVMPYFWRDELIGWGHVNEHVLDVGGSGVSGFAPEARDCYSEALRFPGVRVVRKGLLDPEWSRFIATNVRVPGPVINDLRSMIAAHNTGINRLTSLLDDIGLEGFQEYTAINKRLSEEMVRHRISLLPDGEYQSEDWVEYDARGDRELYEISLRLVIDGDQARFVFHSDPQADCFINATRSVVLGQSMTTLLCQLLWDVPVNAGVWRPFEFDYGPIGTILNPVPPAPTTQGHMETGMRLNKMVSDVISQAASLSTDERLRGRAAGQPGNGPTSTTLVGIDRRSGRRTVMFPMSPPHCQGGGAQTNIDGLDTYGSQCTLGTGVPAVEIEESTAPMRVLWRRIAPNSGGAGYRTGGHGISMGIAIVGSDEMSGTGFNSVAEVVPRGFAGGLPGGASDYHIYRGSNIRELIDEGRLALPGTLAGELTRPPANTGSLRVKEWDTFVFTSSGGGGLGDPLLRPSDRVADDVNAGYVTREAAKSLFGVVVDNRAAVDTDATEATRRAVRTARLGHEPTRELRDESAAGIPVSADLTVGVGRDGDRWQCNYCGEDLGPVDDNYRSHAVTAEGDVGDDYALVGMQVRPRPDGDARVVTRAYFCPACAYSVAVDVTLASRGLVPSPELKP